MRDRCLIASAPLSLIISEMNTCFNSFRIYYCTLIFVIIITVCFFMQSMLPLKDLILWWGGEKNLQTKLEKMRFISRKRKLLLIRNLSAIKALASLYRKYIFFFPLEKGIFARFLQHLLWKLPSEYRVLKNL